MGANRAYFRVTRGCPNPSELSTDLLYMPGDVQRRSEMLRGAQKWSGNHRSRQFLSKEQTSRFVQESVDRSSELRVSIHIYIYIYESSYLRTSSCEALFLGSVYMGIYRYIMLCADVGRSGAARGRLGDGDRQVQTSCALPRVEKR